MTVEPPAAEPLAPDPRRWWMLPVVLSAMFIAVFDVFVVNVAAPSLRHDLNASDAALELIVGGYAFTYASGMVTGGRMGDLYGYRRLFLIGMASFAVASVLCGVAQTSGQLVAARLLQGLTGAAMVPQVLALITATFPEHERSRALSWFGVAGGLAAVAGQVLGGLLLDADLFGLGWRVIFLINLPVGVVALGFALRVVPGHVTTQRPRLDPLGAIGISAGLALVLVPLVLGHTADWPAWTWISLAAAGPVIAATLYWERILARRGGQPLLDLPLFRNRSFVAGLAVNVAFMAFFASFMFILTMVLQSGMGLDPFTAGLTFGPLAMTFAMISMLGPRLLERYGLRVITLGVAVSGLGLLTLLVEARLIGTDIDPAWLIPPMVLVGMGNGLAFPSLIGASLTGVHAERAGAAAGLLTTTQQFSGATGVAVLGSVFFAALGAAPVLGDFLSALELVGSLDLMLVVVSVALTLLLPRTAEQAAHPRASRHLVGA